MSVNGYSNKAMSETLMERKKEELLEIGRLIEVKLASSWTKAKLVDQIAENYKAHPEKLLKTLSKDTIMFLDHVFTQECSYNTATPANEEIELMAEVAIDELEALGLIIWAGDQDDTQGYVSNQLKEVLADYIKTAEAQELIDLYDRYEQTILGMFNYYGVIEIRQLHQIFCETVAEMEDEEFYKFLRQRYGLTVNVFPLIDEDGDRLFLYSCLLEEPNIIVNEQLSRKGLDYKRYRAEQFLAAGHWEYIEQPQGFDTIVDLLVNKGIDAEEAELRLFTINLEIKNEAKQQIVLDSLLEGIEFASQDELEELLNHLQVYINHLPLWVLKGHTANDLAGTTVASAGKTVVNENKVGRNEPCPCGTGKKYKKCCGR